MTRDSSGRQPGGGPGLVVHRASRGDQLVAGLVQLLGSELPDDPFVAEVVSVPTRGVERWLTQSLAEGLGGGSAGGEGTAAGEGVCAGIRLPTLHELLASVEQTALGDPDPSPWRPERLQWSVLEALDGVLAESWAAPLAAHVGPPGEAAERHVGRRWATAHRLARLFARYESERPELLRDWAAGRDGDVPADLAWQPRLWRATAAVVPGPDPSDRLQDVLTALRTHPQRQQLPARLSVFGPTRLTRRQLRLLSALAEHRAVHLWLPHTSPARWEATAARLSAAPPAPPVRRRARTAAPTTGRGHRLVQRLGRDEHELQLALAGTDHRDVDHDHADADAATGASLLQLLQRGVRQDRAPAPARSRPCLLAGDRSVQIHSSHGPDRQVEVLREVLLGLLADDPTLEPRDVVVMCPDVEAFAPLVQATFGLAGSADEPDGAGGGGLHPGHRLRVRLADRSLRQVNPLLELLTRLLALVASRAPASDLVDLALTPAVARRLGLRPDHQQRLVELVRQSGMRWGIDHLHRDQFGMRRFRQNTWAAGLQRLLLGVAMSEDGHPTIGTVLPLDGVGSSDVELVGVLAELVSRVRATVTRFEHPQSVQQWVAGCRDALESLARPAEDEQWQLGHALGQLGDLQQQVPDRAAPRLTPAEFAALLGEELQGRPTRGSFGTGALTLCTLSPMRAVPHRVVVLLGLDDGVFPRRGSLDGDDLLVRDPLVGEHDPLSQDRQLLLDAVMAATQTLVVVHAGADTRSGAPRPEAVPLRELLDAVDETVRSPDPDHDPDHDPDQRPPSERIRTRHPLQPFAPSGFGGDGLPPSSFDVLALAGARAAVGRDHRGVRGSGPDRSDAPGGPDLGWLAELPTRPVPDTVELAQLVRFFRHPAAAFAAARLGLGPSWSDEGTPDEMAVRLDGLQQWAVGERVLRQALQGEPWERLRRSELLRGDLPPGALGAPVLEQVRSDVSTIIERSGVDLTEVAEVVEARVDLGAQTVTGAVGGVRGELVTALTYSQLKAERELGAWLELLLLSAALPDRRWRAQLVGRVTRWSQPVRLEPVEPERARHWLGQLVALYLAGLQRPLPLPPGSAALYARARRAGRDDAAALADRGFVRMVERELDDPTWRQLLGPDLDSLTAEPAGSPVRAQRSEHRFGACALTVWDPLLEHRSGA